MTTVFDGKVSYPNTTNYATTPFAPTSWYGATSDTNGTITSLLEENPTGSPTVGLVKQTGAGFFTINGSPSDSVDVFQGEILYKVLILKPTSPLTTVRFLFRTVGGEVANAVVNTATGDRVSGDDEVEVKKLGLANGYILIQVSLTASLNFDGLYCTTILESLTGAVPPLDTTLIVQGDFFGRTGKKQESIVFPNSKNLLSSPFETDNWDAVTNPKVDYDKVGEGNPSGEGFVGSFSNTSEERYKLIGSSFSPVIPAETMLYFNLLVKPTGSGDSLVFKLEHNDGSVQLEEEVKVNITTGEMDSIAGQSGAFLSAKSTLLTNGYYIVDVKATTRFSYPQRGTIFVETTKGNVVKCQAAYFGETGKLPSDEIQSPYVYFLPDENQNVYLYESPLKTPILWCRDNEDVHGKFTKRTIPEEQYRKGLHANKPIPRLWLNFLFNERDYILDFLVQSVTSVGAVEYVEAGTRPDFNDNAIGTWVRTPNTPNNTLDRWERVS